MWHSGAGGSGYPGQLQLSLSASWQGTHGPARACLPTPPTFAAHPSTAAPLFGAPAFFTGLPLHRCFFTLLSQDPVPHPEDSVLFFSFLSVSVCTLPALPISEPSLSLGSVWGLRPSSLCPHLSLCVPPPPPPTLCQCGKWTPSSSLAFPLCAPSSSLTSVPLSWTLSLTLCPLTPLWSPTPCPRPLSPRVLFQPGPRLPLTHPRCSPAPQTWSCPGLGGEAADPVCPGRA